MDARTVFPITTGTKDSHGVQSRVSVGCSILYEGESHYVVKLQMFPFNTYYMVKNTKKPMEYFLFSKRRVEGTVSRFFGLVGIAHLDDKFKTHMEMEFALFPTKLFMRLQPISEVQS